MSTNALALAIVRTVVREQLIDVVLDDGEPSPTMASADAPSPDDDHRQG